MSTLLLGDGNHVVLQALYPITLRVAASLGEQSSFSIRRHGVCTPFGVVILRFCGPRCATSKIRSDNLKEATEISLSRKRKGSFG